MYAKNIQRSAHQGRLYDVWEFWARRVDSIAGQPPVVTEEFIMDILTMDRHTVRNVNGFPLRPDGTPVPHDGVFNPDTGLLEPSMERREGPYQRVTVPITNLQPQVLRNIRKFWKDAVRMGFSGDMRGGFGENFVPDADDRKGLVQRLSSLNEVEE